MASATLNTLVGASKPAVTNGGGIAAALLAAAGGGSAPGAAGGTGALPGAPGTGTAAAPASIVDFLAMLSGMIETPETSATSGAAATAAANPDAIKSDQAQSGSGNDMGELYAQLLALMQGGSGAGAQAPVASTGGTGADGGAPSGVDGAGAALAAASPVANATGAAANAAAGTDGQTSAQQTAAAAQRDLIAKLLGQSGGGADDSTDDTDGSAAGSGGKGIAGLLEKDLQSLFAGSSSSGGSGTSVSLSDLSALLGQSTSGANVGAAHTGTQPDPSLLQASAASAPATAGPTTATPDSASAAHSNLTAPVGTAAWTEQLGTHLTWMAGNDQQSASLKLTPPHLGPLEIQITMGDDNKASVLFSAPHADTRAALGEALPRLRELFGASGLTLADASVSREPSRQKPRSQTPDPSVSRVGSVSGDDAAASLGSRIAALHAGILDTYA